MTLRALSVLTFCDSIYVRDRMLPGNSDTVVWGVEEESRHNDQILQDKPHVRRMPESPAPV